MTETWELRELDPDPFVRVASDRTQLSPATEQKVAALWKAARAQNPALFNGEVFSADIVTRASISGHWTEYRRILAQARDASLAPILKLRPLAVAGLIEGPDGIIFGRRGNNAVYQPAVWQLAPAGNVDPAAARGGRIDLLAALAIELREELGLPLEAVFDARVVCAVQHPRLNILDIGIALRTNLRADALLRAHETDGDGEYPSIAIVPRRQLAEFLAGRHGPVGPQAQLFLSRYGLPLRAGSG